MTLLTLEALQAAAAYAFRDVEVPALGGTVRLRDISGADRDRVVRFFHDNKDDAGGMLRNWELQLLVIGLSLCDEAGVRVLSDDQIMPVLGRYGGGVIADLYAVAAQVSGLAPAAKEDASKNSEAGQS